jgi:sugar phosphate isomerase/epimerase
MKTGFMLMSDRGPDGQPADWRRDLTVYRQHGLQAVDLFDVMLRRVGETVTGVKRLLDELGLEPSLYAVATDLVSPEAAVRQASLDTVRRGIDACAELGVNHLFSHGGQHANQGEEALDRYVDGLRKAAELTSKAGLVLSIENAGTLCGTWRELARCIDRVGRPDVGITLDGGNFYLAGDDSHEAVEQLADRVVHVHVKSFVPDPGRTPRPWRYCPTGQGRPDYRYIRDTLAAAGFDGCMSFEPEGGEDSQWTHSLDVLSEIIAKTRSRG